MAGTQIDSRKRDLISIVLKQAVECVWALACAAGGVVALALDGAVAAVLLMNGTWAHGHLCWWWSQEESGRSVSHAHCWIIILDRF